MPPQNEGITDPPPAIKQATRTLVHKLSMLASDEPIQVDVHSSEPVVARYVQAATGEGIAEVPGNRD